MSTEDYLDKVSEIIPKESAAIIMHADGSFEMLLPKTEHDDDAMAPNALAIAAIAVLLRDSARVDALIEETFAAARAKPN